MSKIILNESELKQIYDDFVLNNGLVGDVCKKYGMKPYDMLKNAEKYAVDYLNKTLVVAPHYNLSITRYVNEVLLKANSEEEVINIINKSGIALSTIKSSILGFSVKYEDNNNIYNDLQSKCDIYNNYLKEIKNENDINIRKDKERVAKAVIEVYIEDFEGSLKDFCKYANITLGTLHGYIDIIKECDKGLYKRYSEKANNRQLTTFFSAKGKLKDIVKYIKSGITVNDNNREFDILDYYLMTKLSFKQVVPILKNDFDKDELITFRKFMDSNARWTKDNKVEKQGIMKEIITIKTNNDIVYTLSDEDKLNIFKTLYSNEIPVNRKTFSLMLRRIQRGEFILENIDVKKREKNK